MRWQDKLNRYKGIELELRDSGINTLNVGDSVTDIVESVNNFRDIPEMSGLNYEDEVNKYELIEALKSGDIDGAIQIREKFLQGHEGIVLGAAKEGFIYALKSSDIDDAIKIRDEFLQGHEGILNPDEVLDAAKEGFIYALSRGDISHAIKIAIKIRDEFLKENKGILHSKEVLKAAKEGFIYALNEGYISSAIKIRDEFLQGHEGILNPDEVLAAAKEGVILSLKRGYIDAAIKIRDEFLQGHEGILNSDKVLEAAKVGVIETLRRGNIYDAIQIRNEFLKGHEGIVILNSDEVLKAAKERLILSLKSGYIYNAIQIRDKFLKGHEGILKSGEVLAAAKEVVIDALKMGGDYIDRAIQIKDEFLKGHEGIVILNSDEVLKAAKESLIYCNMIDNAIKIRNEFLQGHEGIVLGAAKEVVIDALKMGGDYIDRAIQIKDEFLQGDEGILDSAEVRKAAKEGFINALKIGYIDKAIQIKKEFLQGHEGIVLDAAKEGLINCLKRGYIDRAIEIGDEFLRGVDIIADFVDAENVGDFNKTLLYTYFGKKTDWQKALGKDHIKNFLQTVNKRTDKTQDAVRNAFTHTEYDRVSKFFQFLTRNDLYRMNANEFDVATEYIDKYSLARNSLLYSYFRALKFLDLQEGESPVEKLEKMKEEGKILPSGIDRDLCLKLERDEIQSLDILEKRYKELELHIYSGEKLTADYLEKMSNFEKNLLSSIVGYDTHSFQEGRPSFEEIINDFISYQKSKGYRRFPVEAEEEKNYKPINFRSTQIEYKIDERLLGDQGFDYQDLSREFLNIYQQDLQDLTDRERFEDLKDRVLFKLWEVIDKKKKALKGEKDVDYGNKKIENLKIIIEKLSKLGLEIDDKGDDYDKLLRNILSLDKKVIEDAKLDSELRQIIFKKVIKSIGREGLGALAESLMTNGNSPKAVLGLFNLLNEQIGEHILNKENRDGVWDEETWKAILNAKKEKNGYNLFLLFNKYIDGFTKIVNLMKARERGEGDYNIKCYPTTDDFLGEVSGYLGNACYTKVYPLLKRYPENLIPFKFVLERDEYNKELSGSVLVFELKDKAGNKVALLRAFNVPRESEIDVGEFVENFIEEISPTLRARGIKRIIIPGTDGAISNYSMIRQHMHKKYIDGRRPISLKNRFDFNGYNITDNCYVVREL